jgi:signal transduction histidine kinase
MSRSAPSEVKPAAGWLAGGGEMGALIRAFDWSSTPIGPIETWSPALRMMVGFMLANRFPLLLWWGPEFISIYNDPYRPVLGAKHPWGLGRPVRECWSEIWPILQPLIETPFNGGPATWMEDIELEINRHGFVEETHFTIAYSPVPDETAPRGIGGVLATVHEISDKVVSERRVAALHDLGARVSEARTEDEACVRAAATLERHAKDLPFALIYLLEPGGERARLCGTAGIRTGDEASPPTVELGDDRGAGWPLGDARRRRATVTVERIGDRFGSIPQAPGSEPPHTALIVAIPSSRLNEPAGFLVAGISPRLRLDERYVSFLELAATQIGTALTTAREYEEERHRAEALAEIDRAKTLFFSNVSHEFRTPLTLMLGPLEETLADEGDLPAADRERLEVAYRNAGRLLKLVNTLLDFSRIEAGRIQASYEPIDLAALTAELASVFRSTLEKAGLGLVVTCPPLPEPVYVDREMWEKIVLNLLSNAFKFTFDGEIEVRLAPAGNAVALTVRDTGTGIPAEELPFLFERFHRVKGAQGRSYEGSGIGLALVQELVRLHGGSVVVESEMGLGSTFTVTIPGGSAHLPADRVIAERASNGGTGPRYRAYVEEALRWLPGRDGSRSAAATLEPAGSPSGAPAANGRVLLADDNTDMREYVGRLLTEAGYEVESFADGEAAWRAARERAPDIAIVDVMMPRLDGFGLLKAWRADERTATVPVIVLSARAGEEARVEGLAAGADDYLAKPFSARALVATVGAHLQIARIRNEADQLVRESEARFRAFASATSDVVYRMSPDWTEMRYLDGREFIADLPHPSRTWLEKYIHPDDQPLVTETIARAIRSREIFELEHRIIRVDGSLGWTHSKAVPILDARGEIVEWFGAASDVTQRRQAEAALRHADRMEAVGRLAGGVAHEANNQMTVVMGCANFALSAPGLPAGVREDLERIRRAAAHTATVTSQLLAFGRQQMLRPVALDLNALLESFAPVLRRIVGEMVSLELELGPALPPVLADRGALEQVVLNLTLNARDAMPGQGRLRVATGEVVVRETEASRREEPVRPGRYGVLRVSDTGSGMPPETLSRIFEPFFTTKAIGDGSGMGLSTVYGIVRQLGGDIQVTSEVGRGTSFRILLPIAAEAPAAPPASTEGAKAGGSGTVLVVEDESDVRALAVRALEMARYRVLEAKHGAAALHLLAAHHGDIVAIVADVAMPVMGGRELSRQVAERYPGVPVLLVSGYAKDDLVRRGLIADAEVPLLLKPFTPGELVDRVGGLREAHSSPR